MADAETTNPEERVRELEAALTRMTAARDTLRNMVAELRDAEARDRRIVHFCTQRNHARKRLAQVRRAAKEYRQGRDLDQWFNRSAQLEESRARIRDLEAALQVEKDRPCGCEAARRWAAEAQAHWDAEPTATGEDI